MTWIRLEDNYSRHPKVKRFARLIGNPLGEAYVLRLWTFASECQPDGDLSGLDDGDIADAVGFTGRPETLVGALVESGLLDASRAIHDWADYQLAIINKREADRARSQQNRALRSAESRDRRATVEGPSKDRPATVEGPSRATVRDGTRRDETMNEEPAPTADAAVPAPEGKPEQTSLIALPDKPKSTPRKATPEQQQADAWRAKALGIAGIAEGDAGPWPKGIFHQWRRAAKARGVETLMRSLDGIARMPPTEFARKRGWVHWISGEGIDAGLAALAAPNAPAASRGASNAISGGGSVREWREYDRPPPEPGPDWTPDAALAKLIHRPAFMAHEPPGRFVVPKGKSLGDFDVSRIPPQHLPILDLNVEGS